MSGKDIAPSIKGRREFEGPDCGGYVEDYPGQDEEGEEFHGYEAGCYVDLWVGEVLVMCRRVTGKRRRERTTIKLMCINNQIIIQVQKNWPAPTDQVSRKAQI